MKNDIVKLPTQEQALEVYTGEWLPEFLVKIRENAVGFVADVKTIAGRKAIASKAHEVAKAKVVLDNLGKSLVADLKAQTNKVDASRKDTRDYLDALKIEVREPLTLWENEEAERIELKRLVRELLEKHERALSMNVMFDKEKELKDREEALRASEEKLEKKRKLAKDKADKLAREKEIADQAELKARLKAELIAKEKEEKVEKEKQAIVDNAVNEKKELKILLQKEKDDAIAVEKKKFDDAEKERQELADKLLKKAEEDAAIQQKKYDNAQKVLVEEEAERKKKALKIAADMKLKAEEEILRKANKEHQTEVATEAKDAFVKLGFDEENSLLIIRSIHKGEIPHITINY